MKFKFPDDMRQKLHQTASVFLNDVFKATDWWDIFEKQLLEYFTSNKPSALLELGTGYGAGIEMSLGDCGSVIFGCPLEIRITTIMQDFDDESLEMNLKDLDALIVRLCDERIGLAAYIEHRKHNLPDVEFSAPAKNERLVSRCCEGELCFCGQPAEHKVEETIFDDDPIPHRHPLTRYVCHKHFCEIMGPATFYQCPECEMDVTIGHAPGCSKQSEGQTNG